MHKARVTSNPERFSLLHIEIHRFCFLFVEFQPLGRRWSGSEREHETTLSPRRAPCHLCTPHCRRGHGREGSDRHWFTSGLSPAAYRYQYFCGDSQLFQCSATDSRVCSADSTDLHQVCRICSRLRAIGWQSSDSQLWLFNTVGDKKETWTLFFCFFLNGNAVCNILHLKEPVWKH